MQKFILLAFFVSFTPVSALAEWEVTTEFEISGISYLDEGEPSNFLGNRFSSEIVFEDWQSPWKVVLEPRLRFDSEGFADGIRDSSDRSRANLGWDEAYVGYSDGSLRLRLGWQKIQWGKTVNSLGDLCGYDFTRIPERRCRSSPILDLRYGGSTFVEAFLQPIFTPSLLPRGRWSRVPSGVRLLESRDEVNQPQGGLRLGTVLGVTNLQLVFYHGYANNPYGEAVRLNRQRQVVIEPRYSEEDLISASIVRDIPFWKLHGKAEVSYLKQEHGDDFVQYALSLERLFSRILTSRDQLFVAVQYTGEDVTEADESIIQFRSNIRRAFEGALLGKIAYRLNPRWSFNFRSTYNFEEDDYFLEPAATWTPSGAHVQIEAGVRIVGGPESSFWGQYEKNDSIFTRLTWKF